jgi:hypothetical protein
MYTNLTPGSGVTTLPTRHPLRRHRGAYAVAEVLVRLVVAHEAARYVRHDELQPHVQHAAHHRVLRREPGAYNRSLYRLT